MRAPGEIALAIFYVCLGNVAAFAPYRMNNKVHSTLSQRNVATVPQEITTDIAIGSILSTEEKDKQKEPIDFNRIALSGLKGKALSLTEDDYPKANAIKKVIPSACFEPETAISMSYLAVSAIGTAICTAIGVNLLDAIPPSALWSLPIWAAYSAVTGTVAMGLWVLAHECGHGAFSKNKALQDAVGFVLHSILLVPYYSWQRSHAVHHKFTNHMDLGETHVPEPISGESYSARSGLMSALGETSGLRAWGAIQGFLHLIIGWPAYLLIGATGGPARGMTNHFVPDPLTEPPAGKNVELFPGQWKEKVLKSDIGVAAVVGGLIAWAICRGLPEVMALYGGPYLVVNAWLVVYTWLQHTDVDVPHFSDEDHNFVRGAFHSIDRPYDQLDPWGVIDFLHHKIGTTHVAHHFDCTIPHYKAEVATNAIKENFPEIYLYDPTPIPQALWRLCKGCTAVEKQGNYWVWKNEGLLEKL